MPKTAQPNRIRYKTLWLINVFKDSIKSEVTPVRSRAIHCVSAGTVRLDLRNLKNVHTPDANRTTTNTIKPIFKR